MSNSKDELGADGMRNRDLPESWILSTIGEVCEPPQYGYTTKASLTGDLRLLRTTDITKGAINWEAVPYCADNPDNPEKYLLQHEDIVISRAGSVGVSCLLSYPEKSVFASYLIRFRPSINKKFFRYFLDSPFYWNEITENKLGIAVPNVNASKLKEIPFPLPPEHEQKSIVAKIEELFSELDSGVASLKTAQQQLKIYRQSLLKHAFEGKLTEQWRKDNADKLETPEQLLARIQTEREARYQQQLDEWKQAVKDWEAKGKEGKKPSKPREFKEIELSDHVFNEGWLAVNLGGISNVTGGLTKNQKRNSYGIQIPYLRVANVYANELRLDEIKTIGVTVQERETIFLEKNDLLVVEGNGSIEQIGRVALWNGAIQECGHQNHLIRARLHNASYAKLILYFLLSPVGRDFIVNEASSTSGLHTLSLTKVSNILVPVITQKEADKLVIILEEKLSIIEQNEKEIESALAKAELLRQSILKKAFSGKLTLIRES